MFVEILIAASLPARHITTLPTAFVEGISNWLMDGYYHRRIESPDISPALALANLYTAFKLMDPGGKVRFGDESRDILEDQATEEEMPDLKDFPAEWSRGLVEGTLYFCGTFSELEFVLHGRLFSRVRSGEPALRMVLRGAYRHLVPMKAVKAESSSTGESDSSGIKSGFDTPDPNGAPSDPTFEADLESTFNSAGDFRNLRALLLSEGEKLANQLGGHIARWCQELPSSQSRVVVLDPAAPSGGLLRGFRSDVVRSLRGIGATFDRMAPTIDETYRSHSDGQLYVWRGNGQRVEGWDVGIQPLDLLK